ncbi:TPA: peptide synthetase, partial [Aeromonas dhakensis]|nr:peptide synthetase [Aeromonas dhakensis]
MTVTIKHEAPLVQTRSAPREGAANLGARLAACLAATPLAPAIRMGGEGISEGGSDEQWLSYGALN